MIRRSNPTFVLAVTILSLSGCDLLPGTDAYEKTRAEESVARLLIDPASAQFRNVEAHDNVICGEVNGKNRMGAYVGFVHFYVETSNWEPFLQPNPDDTDSAIFEVSWTAMCGRGAAPEARLPFDPTSGDQSPEIDPEFGNMETANSIPADDPFRSQNPAASLDDWEGPDPETYPAGPAQENTNRAVGSPAPMRQGVGQDTLNDRSELGTIINSLPPDD